MDYMRRRPADFYASVTNGKGKMPAFKDQPDGDRWNATYYLWHWFVPGTVLAQGYRYEAYCITCHAPMATDPSPRRPATNVEFISTYPAAQFFKSISGGKGIMPAWQDRLSDDERWAVVERARSFAYEPAIGGAPQPSEPGPTRAAEQPTQTPAPTEAPAATQAPIPAAAPAGDAAAGQQTWATKPCIGCHGANAEGGVGTKLAGTALTLEEVTKAVRSGVAGTAMMAFGEAQISDKELADIYAWLKSQ
jgi:mono/diheme cytochrome c family protein